MGAAPKSPPKPEFLAQVVRELVVAVPWGHHVFLLGKVTDHAARLYYLLGKTTTLLYGKKYGGADPQLIEGDNFRMIISIPEFGENPAKPVRIVPTAQVTAQVEAQVDLTRWQMVILKECSLAERTGKDLMAAAGYRSRTGNFKKGLQQLVDHRLVELSIPDKPRNRLQKYRLTAKGRTLIAIANKNA